MRPARRARHRRCPRRVPRRPRHGSGGGTGGAAAALLARCRTAGNVTIPPGRTSCGPWSSGGAAAKAAATSAHGHVDQLAAAGRHRARDRERAADAGQRIRDRIGAEHRLPAAAPPSSPADQPARHRGVVAERDQARCRAAVPGDAEPDLAVRVRDHFRCQPQVRERARPRRLDHHVCGASSAASAARPATVRKSAARLRCPACSQSKNSRLPDRAPSGRSGVSTLMTCAPASPRSRAHSGPAHIDDRSATTAPASRALADGGAMRAVRHGGQLPVTGTVGVGRAAAGTPSSWAAAASSSAGRASAAASSALPRAPLPRAWPAVRRGARLHSGRAHRVSPGRRPGRRDGSASRRTSRLPSAAGSSNRPRRSSLVGCTRPAPRAR